MSITYRSTQTDNVSLQSSDMKTTPPIDNTDRKRDEAKRAAIALFTGIETLSNNKRLIETISQSLCLPEDNVFAALPSSVVAHLCLFDISRCIRLMGHGINDKRENYPLQCFIAILIGHRDWLDSKSIDRLNDEIGNLDITQYVIENISKDRITNDILPGLIIMREADTDCANHYATLLYRFCRVIALADDIRTEDEKILLDRLMTFRDITAHTPQEHKNNTRKTHVQAKPETNKKEYQDALDELNSLIGLNEVKDKVKDIASMVLINKQRKKQGLLPLPISQNYIFTGNPGTGKTTVARIITDIYRALGVLNKGQLIETDRSGLVAEYVGQTASKTNETINSALDGVLFIDEAYALNSNSPGDYGKEAISTLLTRMENDRERLMVILAGYDSEMRDFINSNSGLKSRFTKEIHFEDFDARQLEEIFRRNMDKYGYKFGNGARKRLREVISYDTEHKDKNFGNARYIRNLFQSTLEKQARRLGSISTLTVKQLSTILSRDIPSPI